MVYVYGSNYWPKFKMKLMEMFLMMPSTKSHLIVYALLNKMATRAKDRNIFIRHTLWPK